MTKTMEEINAEKAAKPRPDLLPATALLFLENGPVPDTWPGQSDGGNPMLWYFDAREALRTWKAYGDLELLRTAGIKLAQTIFTLEDADQKPYEIDRARSLGRVPAYVIWCASKVQAYGFQKHGKCTWRNYGTEQADPQTHLASLERHLLEWEMDPEAVESGSGFPVLWHAFAQICILIDLVLDPPKPLEHKPYIVDLGGGRRLEITPEIPCGLTVQAMQDDPATCTGGFVIPESETVCPAGEECNDTDCYKKHC